MPSPLSKSPRSHTRAMRALALSVALTISAFNGCTTPPPPTPASTGERLFNTPFAATNGRACSTCHVPSDNFTLTPAHAEALWASNPNDPLFRRIDADDPEAATPTYDHLRKGLVRVWLTLPANMDVIDMEGRVTTPTNRRIFVWRSVPSIADSALTAPYQLDGHVRSLEEQAQGAVTGHSEGPTIPAADLALIAAYERTIFSSDRTRRVAQHLASGGDPARAPDVEGELSLTPEEERGREVYRRVCATCHGGSNGTTIVNRSIHALAFPELKPDGNVRYTVPATNPPTPVLAPQTNNEFINIGSAVENFLVSFGATEHQSYTRDLSFPHYRFRFYADATRSSVVADLPPALPMPGTSNPRCNTGPGPGGDGGAADGGSMSGDASAEGGPGPGPGDEDGGGAGFAPVFDENCNPVVGPNFTTQFFTTDPGRAAVTGSPYDFEAFDIPTLRGISRTAPYWHNNISESLEGVINLYSDHLLAKFPPLTINNEPPQVDPNGDIGPIEALSETQKRELLAFLRRL